MRLQLFTPGNRSRRTGLGLAGLIAVSLLGGCAQVGGPSFDLLAENTEHHDDKAAPAANAAPQSELQKATNYWGQKYSKDPRDADAALSYAKNLKAMGQKQQALMVLQQASMFHGQDRRIASEYGRLALDLDQIGVAAQLLETADDPTRPDWRVITARGTVHAKQGKYAEAIPFYERALTLAPGQASILNNLALAQTMSGNASKGEELMRQAVNARGATPKVQENLALVLGVTGKYEESKQVAAAVMPASDAAANVALIRNITHKEGVATPAPQASVQLASAKPAATPGGAARTIAKAKAGDAGGTWSAVVADGDTGAGQTSGPALRASKD